MVDEEELRVAIELATLVTKTANELLVKMRAIRPGNGDAANVHTVLLNWLTMMYVNALDEKGCDRLIAESVEDAKHMAKSAKDRINKIKDVLNE